MMLHIFFSDKSTKIKARAHLSGLIFTFLKSYLTQTLQFVPSIRDCRLEPTVHKPAADAA